MKLKPIKNNITFKFVDKVVVKTDMGKRRTQFEEETEAGLIFSSYDEGTKLPRWGIVVDVGPGVVEDINPGDQILIEAMRWTEAIEVDGENIWRTDEDQVIAVRI